MEHNSDTDCGRVDTRELVRRAARELAAAGERVTVRGVRARIGRGSSTTIAAEIRRWNLQELASAAASTGGHQAAGLPAALQAEAQLLFIRAVQAAGEKHAQVVTDMQTASLGQAARQDELFRNLAKSIDFSAILTSQLIDAVAERARLSATLTEKNLLLEEALAQATRASERVAELEAELASAKLKGAEREALALTRAEALSRHLLKTTEEQRAQIAAPLASLRERLEALQIRDQVQAQQLNALRAEIANLRERNSAPP